MKKLIQQYAKDLTAGRLATGFEHSYRVYNLARRIGAGTEYDDEVLHAACFLHDIMAGADHPESSAEKARAILQETGFFPAKIASVVTAIRTHMPEGGAESVEARLLHDANLLDTLGAVGVTRLAIAALFCYHAKTMEELFALLKRWLGYADSFFFPAGAKMARKKARFMKLALEELERELIL
jgi:HD superfamily phosphodiesterase